MRFTGWGRTPGTVSQRIVCTGVDDVIAVVRAAPARGVLARGLGRSYGDAALNAGGRLLDLSGLNHCGPIGADGLVTVGAGVSLHDLIATALPQGWFVPVTPGTRQVSIGGAIAADVHGKNHHRDGSFTRHCTALTLIDGLGELRLLSPSDPHWSAVAGGMGLAGIVVEATIQLIPVPGRLMSVDTTRTDDLAETMAVLRRDDTNHRYTVAWLDTLAGGGRRGRGIVTSGDHDGGRESRDATYRTPRPLPAPPWAPPSLLNRGTVAAFNEAYYRHGPRRPTRTLQTIPAFFHPLDVVSNWNRIYGSRGFLQYQVAVDDDAVIETVLDSLATAGSPGFLTVLKRFGAASGDPLSFPIPGWTLATDMPADPSLAPVLDRLDQLVVDAGGRTYLAKDSRVDPRQIPVMYPALSQWRQLRDDLDPHRIFSSDLARRLDLC